MEGTPLSIEKTVASIVGDHLGIPGAALRPDARIAEDLGADSLDRAELIMTIEERFAVTIPEGEAKGIERIGDIIACLAHLLPAPIKKGPI